MTKEELFKNLRQFRDDQATSFREIREAAREAEMQAEELKDKALKHYSMWSNVVELLRLCGEPDPSGSAEMPERSEMDVWDEVPY